MGLRCTRSSKKPSRSNAAPVESRTASIASFGYGRHARAPQFAHRRLGILRFGGTGKPAKLSKPLRTR